MTFPPSRTAAAALVGAAGVLLLLSAAIGFRSSLGYLSFQLAMLLLVISFVLALWAGRPGRPGRPGRDGTVQPGLRWHLVMWCAVMAELGFAVMVLGERVFGASVIGVAIVLMGVGWLFSPRGQKAHAVRQP